ncbi:hypothetical protein AC244_25590 [Ensifer adhaerens]|uniref:Uncharacterized protein n=1 Tax=Ensifer adhaerens TaxID=106592 RepID=A0A0L8BKB4_ENSAD|nr:hypothetical protein AC244_25590 [Ensifer adhaerens]
MAEPYPWRHMASAPKNGSRILVTGTVRQIVRTMRPEVTRIGNDGIARGEIGMPAHAGRHRPLGAVLHRQGKAQAFIAEFEMLLGTKIPRPVLITGCRHQVTPSLT